MANDITYLHFSDSPSFLQPGHKKNGWLRFFLPAIEGPINFLFAKGQATYKRNQVKTDRKLLAACTIRGNVKDPETMQYLTDADVSLFQNGILFRKMSTDSNGSFRFDLKKEDLRSETFTLHAEHMGYKKLEMKRMAFNKRYMIFHLELKAQPAEVSIRHRSYFAGSVAVGG